MPVKNGVFFFPVIICSLTVEKGELLMGGGVVHASLLNYSVTEGFFLLFPYLFSPSLLVFLPPPPRLLPPRSFSSSPLALPLTQMEVDLQAQPKTTVCPHHKE